MCEVGLYYKPSHNHGHTLAKPKWWCSAHYVHILAWVHSPYCIYFVIDFSWVYLWSHYRIIVMWPSYFSHNYDIIRAGVPECRFAYSLCVCDLFNSPPFTQPADSSLCWTKLPGCFNCLNFLLAAQKLSWGRSSFFKYVGTWTYDMSS